MPETPAGVADLLVRHLPAVGLTPGPELVRSLAGFVALLARWNQAYNLTSVRDPVQMVYRHILDSLAVRPFLQGTAVLDVGCGAGLPGIPLALAEPARRFTLLDAALKKIRFVRQAIAELAIANVTAVQVRLADHAPPQPYDTIICRAFAALGDFAGPCAGLLAPGGRLVAMKGRLPAAELAALPPGWQVREVTRVRVPGLDAERHVVVLGQAPP